MTRQISLYDFLTEGEINKAAELKDRKAVRDQIIKPNMERINKALGQENDPDYLSFAIEHIMVSAGAW